jgi:acetamidase/formamidase
LEDLIWSEEQDFRDIDFSRVNGAVGPIYVEGAEPGGVLKVEVLGVEVEGDRGVMAVIPGFGLLKEYLKIYLSSRSAESETDT